MMIYDEAMQMKEELVACRRDLHAHPELAWTEFRTASHVAKSLKALGYEVLMGDACMKADEMMGVPDKAELSRAMGRAIKEGADPELVKKMEGGKTGVVGIMHFAKPGKTVGLRFDMDCLLVEENPTDAHRPTRDGFASTHPGLMHACGHDGHTAIGLGVARLIAAHKERSLRENRPMPVPIPKMAATPFLQRPKLRWPSIPFPVTATALPALMWEFSRQGRDETSSPTTRSSNLRPVAGGRRRQREDGRPRECGVRQFFS